MYKQKKCYDVKKTAELFKPPRRHATSTLEHICNLKSMKNKEPKTEGLLSIDILYDIEEREKVLTNI
jgi:hypothetical protein